MKDITKLPPFKHFVSTIGNLPSSYVDSLSYYETLVWLCKYLKDTVIPAYNSNVEAIQELQSKYIELKEYVDSYFENLDVQEEINNKLDDMAENGTLEEIITAYINLKSILCYDTVADMKEADNLVDGSFAQTLGFHSKNDGGAAIYKIRTITNEDTVNEMDILSLNDETLIAELINNNVYNVKQYGAYGDNEHDDTDVLDYIFKKLENGHIKIEIPEGTYLISDTLVIKESYNEINGLTSKIVYTGNYSAIKFTHASNSNINLGTVVAENGNAIEFYSSSTNERSQYVNLTFVELIAGNDCIRAEVVGGWENENRIYKGRLTAGINGIHLINNVPDNSVNGWRIEDVGFEGVDNCLNLEATQGSIQYITIRGCRYDESFVKQLVTSGRVENCYIYNCDKIFTNVCEFSSDTNWYYIYSPVTSKYVGFHGGKIMNGIFVPDEEVYLMAGGSVHELENGADLNDILYSGTYTGKGSQVTNGPTISGPFRMFVINLEGSYETFKPTKNYLYFQQIIIYQDRIYVRYVHFEGNRTNPTTTAWKQITMA
jgi:hypothetical protein